MKRPMNRPTRSNATKCIGRWGGPVFYGLLLVLAIIMIVGCTPERRYKVLSFFFDGVPDPNAPKVDRNAGQVVTTSSGRVIRVYQHKPFKDNQCGSCHAVSSGSYESFEKLDAKICLKCHANELTRYPVMHGPVASVQCLTCHSPHESAIPGLLKEKAPGVCTQCHVPDLRPKDKDHQSPASPCLTCHVGHGSNKQGLLRKSIAAAPTTAPAGVPK